MPHKVVKVQARSGSEIDKLALGIIKVYQPEILTKPQPFDIERFFECDVPESFEITTEYRELNVNIHGYTDSDLKECIISKQLMDDKTQERYMRATIAHECGHCVLHVPELVERKDTLKFVHDLDHVTLKLYRAEDIPIYQNPEWQAWRFAGALLMPAGTFYDVIKCGYSDKKIADMFQVNPAFVNTRARALKLR